MEDSDPSVVIPIAGEVHNVFGVEPGEMVNTGIGVTAKKYTYEVIIELADQTRTEPPFSKDNLDFFICYQYKSMEQRMEVHLYEFWGYGATAAGTIQQENLDLAGNNTSAIPKKQSMCHVLISPRQAHIRNSSIGPKTEPSIRNGTNTR